MQPQAILETPMLKVQIVRIGSLVICNPPDEPRSNPILEVKWVTYRETVDLNRQCERRSHFLLIKDDSAINSRIKSSYCLVG